jgi:integrase/recombinase XerD
MKYIVDDGVVLSQPLDGPLASHIAGFAKWAHEQGYARYSRYRKVLLAACFSRWLGHQAIGLRCVCSEHPARYLRSRARRVQIYQEDAAALRQLMSFLHGQGVISVQKTAPRRLSPAEQEVLPFEHYLRHERVLSCATVANYVPFIRAFLTDQFGHRPAMFSRLCAGDVVRFVQHQAPRMHVKRAKLLTTALRSFLHYLRYRGDIACDLAAAVPTVANWSMTSIPRAISADSVRRVLASTRRSTVTGRRDYAIMLLLARLGLRSSEVAFLELDDIDWDAGQVSIRGKGGQPGALPLPADVGKAIAAYLQHGRPPSTNRRVFLRTRAPIRGFLGQGAIGAIVKRALGRAAVKSPTQGAHQFRHALATRMLRHGASLAEIGEVLRHRSPETTKIYTQVDLDRLRTLALPWPGGVR